MPNIPGGESSLVGEGVLVEVFGVGAEAVDDRRMVFEGVLVGGLFDEWGGKLFQAT